MNDNRKLSTILFADIVGYTSMMQSNESQAIQHLQTFKSILEDLVPKYGGQIIQYFGDSCLLSFDSTTSGVKCAIALQKMFQENNIPIRIGIHLGEVLFTETNVFGDGVNIASRIESMGVPGSVLVSGVIRDQIKNKSEFELTSMGFFEFKNVEEPIEVFALKKEGLSIPDKSNIQGKLKIPQKKSSRPLWLIAIVALVLISYFVFNYSALKDASKEYIQTVENVEKSIAVLPLRNLNNSEDLDYFSDGVSQEIADELAKISSINAAPFTASFQYKNQEKSQEQIATDLNVKYLISGSLRYFDQEKRIKISVELFDPFNNKLLWSRTFDRQLKDAPSIQLAVAREVASNLDIELTVAEEQELATPSTTSGDAFRLFLQARVEINKLSSDGFIKGSILLEEAIRFDPDYAQAYTMLAWRFAVGGSPDFTPGIQSSQKSIAFTKPFLDKAMELDPTSSDNYIIRGFVKLYLQNRVQDAKKDIDKALSMNSWPKIPINYCLCTGVSTYLAANELANAKQVVRLAKKIDPEHVLYDWDLGNIAMKEGDYLQAQEHYRNSVDKADISFFNTFLGWSYYFNKQYKEALKYLNKAYQSSTLPPRFTVTTLSNTHFQMGNLKKSDQYLQELLERSNNGERHLNLYIANMYLERNEVEKSLEYLEKGVENSDFGLAVFLSLMPKFGVLEEQPRYKEVLRQIQMTEN